MVVSGEGVEGTEWVELNGAGTAAGEVFVVTGAAQVEVDATGVQNGG